MATQQVQITLDKPHAGQQQVLDELQRFNVICCGRRWGKSKLAARILCKTAIAKNPAGYFTPTYKLLEATFKDCLSKLSPIVSKKHDNQFIELITGGVIDFWSMDNPYAGRSRKYKKVVIDEAAFVKNLWDMWTESIRPTLTDLKGDAYFFSTPKGKNDFYKLFMRGKSSEPNWASWQMSTYTNPFIDPLEVDDAKKDLPELAFKQEYLAEFSDNVANPFGLDHISRAVYPLSTNPATCFGIDLAKKNDWTVITGLDRHGNVCYFDRFQKDWKQTREAIISLPNVPTCIDATGTGDAILEDVSRQRDNVEGYVFTAKSKQQLMEGLAFAIQNRQVTVLEGVMKDELDSFEYEYTRTGVRYTAPAGLHDDAVCSLALARHIHGKTVSSGSFGFI